MGHYRSEMGFEREDEERAKRKAAELARLAKGIKADIKKRGIENVLADILTNPGLYKLRRFD